MTDPPALSDPPAIPLAEPPGSPHAVATSRPLVLPEPPANQLADDPLAESPACHIGKEKNN